MLDIAAIIDLNEDILEKLKLFRDYCNESCSDDKIPVEYYKLLRSALIYSTGVHGRLKDRVVGIIKNIKYGKVTVYGLNKIVDKIMNEHGVELIS